jgi:2-amino-4-hydroxy-6-hydroxymethyldihydropteridine diphosphokinase
VLLLGSNLGRRVRRIREAVDRVGDVAEIRAVSRMYATEPYGRPFQPWFLNVAVRIAPQPDVRELLRFARRLEAFAGRRVGPRWGPRPLDVDIVLAGEAVVSEPDLTVPHASMAQRRFCLVPVADVAANAIVPPGGRTVAELLAACEDMLEVIAI